jgi:transposase
MRPYGTSKQLVKRRERALKLLAEGKRQKEVAQIIGVTDRSIRYWRKEESNPKDKSQCRPPGRPSYLSKEQLQGLEQALTEGAYLHGYAEDYWTLDRIAHVIWEKFGVRYHPSAVWHILQRMGWSNQRPQRLALQRDDQTIKHWKHYIWPKIKKNLA